MFFTSFAKFTCLVMSHKSPKFKMLVLITPVRDKK